MLNEFQRALVKRARVMLELRRPCVHCGQRFGGLLALGSDANGPTFAHAMCHEYAKRGLPLATWAVCGACWGLGHIPRSDQFLTDPTRAALEAWCPACEACEGRGWLP